MTKKCLDLLKSVFYRISIFIQCKSVEYNSIERGSAECNSNDCNFVGMCFNDQSKM